MSNSVRSPRKAAPWSVTSNRALWGGALVLLTLGAMAQKALSDPPVSQPAGAGRATSGAQPSATSTPGPRNLQILQKDLSLVDVMVLMARYNQELGVQCTFCHSPNAQSQVIDFASDENPAKQTARIMIGMLRDINEKYLAQVSDRRYAVPITCGNCHQGQTFPPRYEPRAS